MNEDITINSTILVIDDSIFMLNSIKVILKERYSVILASSAKIALQILEKQIPDIILLDLEMPEINGFEFLEILRGIPKWSGIPVVFLTGTDDRKKEEKALNLGAVDYILKPISPGVLTKRIHMHLELHAYQHKLEKLVEQKTLQLEKTQDLILDILANVTTHRDNDTGAHIVRTTNYVKVIVERLLELRSPNYDLEAVSARNIIKSARLHDIGKIGISDGILLKASKLTAFEFEIIKMHTVIGAEMLDDSIKKLGAEDAGFLVTAKELILHHHEWWNGRGYPHKLAGMEIPLSARIMAIADVYDALISKRVYKSPISHADAVEILKSEAGTHFDPFLMDVTIPLFDEFDKIAATYRDEEDKV